jgi:hypothetical protein
MSEKTDYPEWIGTESEKRLHDDFRAFLWLILTHLKLTMTLLQQSVALYLQHGPRRRMVQAFRGMGKSWVTAAYVLWRLYRNPQERILVVSANEDRAMEFANFTRRLIDEVEQLKFLRPRDGTRDSILKFDVGPADAAQAPSVRAVGITGMLTGGRATVIVSDDVEVPKNSSTEAMREKLSELIKEFDAVLVPGGEIIYLGTPQTEQSIYRLVRQRGYDCRVWPARYPTPDQAAKYDGALAPELLDAIQKNPGLIGHTTEPNRFTDLDLMEREASYGKSGFALQFMLDTSLSDADRYPLKTSDLLVMDVDVEEAPVKLSWSSDPRGAWADIPNIGFSGDRMYRPFYMAEQRIPYTGRLLVIDPSGRGGDQTAWVVLYMLNGMIHLKEWGGFTAGYEDETLQGLALVARRHKVRHVLVESNFGDGMFLKLLEPHLVRIHPVTCEEVRAVGQKERRIVDTLEPVLNQHRIVMDAAMARRDASGDSKFSLLYQLTHITKERGALRHDDVLDALAHGVAYFRDQLSRDTSKAEQAHLQKLRDEQLDAFMKKAKQKAGPRPKFQNNSRR